MFENVGKKLKSLAKVMCVIGIIVFIIAAIVLFVAASNSTTESLAYTNIYMGFACLIVGPLGSWISSLFVYGFGELIDKIDFTFLSNNDSVTNSKRIKNIVNLRRQELISEEEYQEAISKINI